MASKPYCIRCGRKWSGPTSDNEIGGRVCPYCMEKDMPGGYIMNAKTKEYWAKEV